MLFLVAIWIRKPLSTNKRVCPKVDLTEDQNENIIKDNVGSENGLDLLANDWDNEKLNSGFRCMDANESEDLEDFKDEDRSKEESTVKRMV